MKGLALLLILFLIGGYLYFRGNVKLPENITDSFGGGASSNPAGFSGNSSTADFLRKDILKTGVSSVYVSLSAEKTLIQLEVPSVNEDLIPLLYTVAREAYSSNPAKSLRVEAYFGEEPLMALNVENGDFESSTLEDIRRPEFRVENALGLFDVVVHNLRVTNDSARVELEYLGDGDSFWRDYGRMSFAVLESVPWVERVEIVYLGDRNVSISIASDDVIKLAKGELEGEELSAAITFRELGQCPPTKEEAYRLFVKAYNNVTSLQEANASQEVLEEAYAKYLDARECYESFG